MRTKFFKGDFFHVFNKSIANFGIFKDYGNGLRFINTLDYYNNALILDSLSETLRNKKYTYDNLLFTKENSLIKVISYCVMPDHYHLLVKILVDSCLSKYINNVENSFTRYFNIKFKRKGPLWQSRFKAVGIKSNEQLLHVSRYIHLNPTTSSLVEKPENWRLSSYSDFIDNEKILKDIIKEISIKNPRSYSRFIEDQKDYQRQLKVIKKLALE